MNSIDRYRLRQQSRKDAKDSEKFRKMAQTLQDISNFRKRRADRLDARERLDYGIKGMKWGHKKGGNYNISEDTMLSEHWNPSAPASEEIANHIRENGTASIPGIIEYEKPDGTMGSYDVTPEDIDEALQSMIDTDSDDNLFGDVSVDGEGDPISSDIERIISDHISNGALKVPGGIEYETPEGDIAMYEVTPEDVHNALKKAKNKDSADDIMETISAMKAKYGLANEDSTNMDYGVKGMKWGKRKGASALAMEEPHGGEKTVAKVKKLFSPESIQRFSEQLFPDSGLNDGVPSNTKDFFGDTDIRSFAKVFQPRFEKYAEHHNIDDCKKMLVAYMKKNAKDQSKKAKENPDPSLKKVRSIDKENNKKIINGLQSSLGVKTNSRYGKGKGKGDKWHSFWSGE